MCEDKSVPVERLIAADGFTSLPVLLAISYVVIVFIDVHRRHFMICEETGAKP